MRAVLVQRSLSFRGRRWAGVQLRARHPLRLLVATAAAAGLAAGAVTAEPAAASPTVRGWLAGRAAGRPAAHGRVQFLHLPSGDADHRSREVWVYHPPGRDRAELPVVYFLHGYPGSDQDADDVGLAGMLDQVFATGVRPFVVAVPDGESTIHPDTEWADSVDGKVRLERFVTDRLIRAVEGRHPRDRWHRAIAGFSMGGYGAMNIGLRHPRLYSQIVSIAGYFHPDDPDGMGGGQPAWAEANSPDRRLPGARRTRLLVVDAAGEPSRLIQGEAVRFVGLARNAGLHPTLAVAPGGHSWSMVASQVPAVVGFLDAGWFRFRRPAPRLGSARPAMR